MWACCAAPLTAAKSKCIWHIVYTVQRIYRIHAVYVQPCCMLLCYPGHGIDWCNVALIACCFCQSAKLHDPVTLSRVSCFEKHLCASMHCSVEHLLGRPLPGRLTLFAGTRCTDCHSFCFTLWQSHLHRRSLHSPQSTCNLHLVEALFALARDAMFRSLSC